MSNQSLQSLYERRAAILSKGRSILSSCESTHRYLSNREHAEIVTLMGHLEDVNRDLMKEQGFSHAEIDRLDAKTKPTLGTKGFVSFGEQLRAVRHASMTVSSPVDARLYAVALGASESVPADGGFIVQPEFAKDILRRTFETGEVSRRCYQFPLTRNRLIISAVDEDSRKDGSRWGGIQAYWENEANNYVGTRPKFRSMELICNKLTGLVYLTDEIVEDAAALGAFVADAFPQEFTFLIEAAIFNGIGAGQPLGINNSGCVIVVAKDTNQPAKTISTTNVLNMWSRLWAPSRKNAVWFVNQDIEPQLYTLALQNPTGAVLFNGPLYTPPGVNGNNSGYGLLLGRPVIPIEQASTLGTQGDIVLADMQQYLLAQKVDGITADTSIHVAYLTGEQAFRFRVRLDGQPMWKKPLTPYQGANTLSPFVALATRN